MRSSRISLVRSRKSTARCSAFALRSNEPPDPGSTAIGAFVALWGFWALLAIAWAREELHLRDVVKLAPDSAAAVHERADRRRLQGPCSATYFSFASLSASAIF